MFMQKCNSKPGIERVQALADIFAFTLCCRTNATCALIAKPPNSAQLGSTPTIPAKLYPGPCSSMGMRPRTDTQKDRCTWPIYISRRLRLMRNVISCVPKYTFLAGSSGLHPRLYAAASVVLYCKAAVLDELCRGSTFSYPGSPRKWLLKQVVDWWWWLYWRCW